LKEIGQLIDFFILVDLSVLKLLIAGPILTFSFFWTLQPWFLHKTNISFVSLHLVNNCIPIKVHLQNFCTFSAFRCQFHQHSMSSVYKRRAQRVKKTVKSSAFLRFWDLCAQKLHVNMLLVGEIDPRGRLHQHVYVQLLLV